MADSPTIVYLTGAGGFVAGALRRALFSDPSIVTVPIRCGETPEIAARSVVVHCAWPGSIDDLQWQEFRDWSIRLRQGARCGARFIGIGSGVEAYEGDDRLKEPYKSYARRKSDLKQALAVEAAEHFSWVRLHFIFGSGERATRFVPAAIRACQTGDAFTCGSLARQRRWLHVDDQATILAAFLKSQAVGDWDIAGRADVSFRDLLAIIEEAVGVKLRLTENAEPTPDGAIGAIVPDRLTPLVPATAGRRDNLLARLREYAQTLRLAAER